MLFWRDRIASAVWSVLREAKDFMSYMTRAGKVNLSFSSLYVFSLSFIDVLNFYNSWECTCYIGFWLVFLV